jgi:hypothetical protein
MNTKGLVNLTPDQLYLIADYSDLEYQLNLAKMRLEKFCTYEFYKKIILDFSGNFNLDFRDVETNNNSYFQVVFLKDGDFKFKLSVSDERWYTAYYDCGSNGSLIEINKFINKLEDIEEDFIEFKKGI